MGGTGEVQEFVTRGFRSLWIRMVNIRAGCRVHNKICLHNNIFLLEYSGLLHLFFWGLDSCCSRACNTICAEVEQDTLCKRAMLLFLHVLVLQSCQKE